MLAAIGARTLDELFSQISPALVLKGPLALPAGLTESAVRAKTKKLAEKNRPLADFNSFLGAGCYDHYIPAALGPLVNRAEFLTAYTPYQPECSQGSLQAIYEYQSYICALTGMDVSNASLFDGASSVAEAALMAMRVTGRSKVLVAESLHPEYRRVLATYLAGQKVKVEEAGFDPDLLLDASAVAGKISDDTSCFVFGYPNFFGMIEDGPKLCQAAKAKGALAVMVVNPTALAFLKDPGAAGADIVCGDGQPLGCGMDFGGPSFGFLAAKNDYLRQMPGRIVGKTVDKDNNPAYCLTLSTREQHIRREKATSNICSNQSLKAIEAAVYLALLGPIGFKKAAQASFELTHYLYGRLKGIKGLKVVASSRFFHEFVWEVPEAKRFIRRLERKNIIAGLALGADYPGMKNSILSCCTEKKTKEEIDEFVEAVAKLI